MAKILNVFLAESKVGVLVQDDHGAISFSYDQDWLASTSPVALSGSLPLQAESFKARECRAFFAGLLPEEENRALVAAKFGVSERNDFAILEMIGAECAGAVSLLSPGQQPRSGLADYRSIDLQELEEKLKRLPTAPLMVGVDGIRLSLAGAQGKAAVVIRNGEYFLPLNGSPSTHLLKPDSERFPGLVDNEFFCMRLAAEIGLDVAPVEIGLAGELRFLQIKRYDREKIDERIWSRIHQEDFCQALGIVPELKYQNEGGPGFADCFALLRSMSSAPAADVLKLFDAVVFNYLIGNNDAHGKNFSLLYKGNETRLAPLYDLVSTAAYPELSQRMAMKIGGEKDAIRVRAKDWLSFFSEVELGPTMAKQRMQKLAGNIKSKTEKLSSEVSGIETLVEILIANCESLISLNWNR